jgi:hypothetical protein
MVGRSMIETALESVLRFLNPRPVIALQGLDRLGRVVLHALEDDDAALAGLDAAVLNVEVQTKSSRSAIDSSTT